MGFSHYNGVENKVITPPIGLLVKHQHHPLDENDVLEYVEGKVHKPKENAYATIKP